jgi:aerobic-type carbon monoxide dehydrogenase small subunit (CoxS/CutS family)
VSTVQRTWKVNGRTVRVRAPAGRRLLDYLREDLG